MNLAGFSTEGPRLINEDAYFTLDLTEARSFPYGISAFLMVSDGMGGHQGGDVASRIAVQAAEHYLDQLLEMTKTNQIALDVPHALKEITRNANEAILKEMQSRGNSGMGATFVGAFISPRKAWIAHVGDSRAYLIRRGEAVQLTKDHSAVGRLLSRGLITEREAQNHPERNVIERALGFTDEDPEIIEVHLARGDAILLCSDGVSTVLSAHLIAESIMRADSIENAVEDVVSLALQKNTDDNATAAMAVGSWNSFKAYSHQNRSFKRRLTDSSFEQGKRSLAASNRMRLNANQYGSAEKGMDRKSVNRVIIVALALALVTGLVAGLWLSIDGDREIPIENSMQREDRVNDGSDEGIPVEDVMQ